MAFVLWIEKVSDLLTIYLHVTDLGGECYVVILLLGNSVIQLFTQLPETIVLIMPSTTHGLGYWSADAATPESSHTESML